MKRRSCYFSYGILVLIFFLFIFKYRNPCLSPLVFSVLITVHAFAMPVSPENSLSQDIADALLV